MVEYKQNAFTIVLARDGKDLCQGYASEKEGTGNFEKGLDG